MFEDLWAEFLKSGWTQEVVMENGTDLRYFAVFGEVSCKLGVSRGQCRPRDLHVRAANTERCAFAATAPSVLRERQRRMRVWRDEGPRVTIRTARLGERQYQEGIFAAGVALSKLRSVGRFCWAWDPWEWELEVILWEEQVGCLA